MCQDPLRSTVSREVHFRISAFLRVSAFGLRVSSTRNRESSRKIMIKSRIRKGQNLPTTQKTYRRPFKIEDEDEDEDEDEEDATPLPPYRPSGRQDPDEHWSKCTFKPSTPYK
jgi:hypothetical protein